MTVTTKRLPPTTRDIYNQSLSSYDGNPLQAPTDPMAQYWYRLGLLRGAYLAEQGVGISPDTDALFRCLTYHNADFEDEDGTEIDLT